jgi:DNA-binding NarL/FixJ family response regulator
VALAAIGFRNGQIVDRLCTTSTVVRSDLAEIFRKLRVASRAELNEAWRARPDAASSGSGRAQRRRI